MDTHVWVWLTNGSARLAERARTRLHTASEAGELRLSAISMWEVGMLNALGRLRFDISCIEWVETALRLPGLSLVPITPSIAVASAALPGDIHRDPADRLIVATAREIDADLVTGDAALLAYAAEGHIRSVPA